MPQEPFTVSKHGLLGSETLPPAAESYYELVDLRRDEMEAALSHFDDAIARTREDRNLSGTGKAEAVQRLAAEARKVIGKLGVPPKITRDLQLVEERLPPRLPLPTYDASKRAITLSRQVERMQDRMEGMDKLVAGNFLREAARTGDPLPLLAAAELPPSVMSLDAELDEAVELWHQTHSVAAVTERANLQRVVLLLESNQESALTYIGSIAGPEPVTVATAAA